MRKIIIYLLVFISFFSFGLSSSFAGNCDYDEDSGDSISDMIGGCLSDSPLVDTGSAEIGTTSSGFDEYILKWIANISLYLGFLAVLSIVVGGLMLTLSSGEDEKINKAKGVVKWGIIGFVGIISASSIITILVKVIYSL